MDRSGTKETRIWIRIGNIGVGNGKERIRHTEVTVITHSLWLGRPRGSFWAWWSGHDNGIRYGIFNGVFFSTHYFFNTHRPSRYLLFDLEPTTQTGINTSLCGSLELGRTEIFGGSLFFFCLWGHTNSYILLWRHVFERRGRWRCGLWRILRSFGIVNVYGGGCGYSFVACPGGERGSHSYGRSTDRRLSYLVLRFGRGGVLRASFLRLALLCE